MFPMLKPVSLCACAYLCGSLFSRWLGDGVFPLNVALFGGISVAATAFFSRRFVGLSLVSLAFLSGMAAQAMAPPTPHVSDGSNFLLQAKTQEPAWITASVIAAQKATSRGIALRVAVQAVQNVDEKGGCLDTPLEMTLSVVGDTTRPMDILPGDLVRVRSKLRVFQKDQTLEIASGDVRSQRSRTEFVSFVERDAVVRFADDTWFPCPKPSFWNFTRHWSRPIEKLRHRMLARIERLSSPEENKALLSALCLGWRGAIVSVDENRVQLEQATLTAEFNRAGISHILSVSGLHLSFVGWLVYRALARAIACVPFVSQRCAGHRFAALLAVLLVAFYTQLTGAEPPTVRAACVLGLWLLAVVCGRRTSLEVGLAVSIFVVGNPFWGTGCQDLSDPSFLLSLAATLGLVYLRPFSALGACVEPSNRPRTATALLRRLLSAFDASSGALLFTAPLVALFFGRFVATGLWANVLLIPLGEMAVLPLGLFGLFIDLVFPSLGQLFLASSHVVAGLFLFFAAQAAKVGWEWTVPAPSLWMVLLFEIGLALWCFRRQLGAGLCSAVLFLYLFNWQRPHDTLKVTILSVGQGDSIVLEFPTKQVMVIDAGPAFEKGRDAGLSVVTPFLRSRGISKIDWLVLTHAHPDHSGGMQSLLREFAVAEFWFVPLPTCHPAEKAKLQNEHRAAQPHLSLLQRRAEARNTKVGPPRSLRVGGVELQLLDSFSRSPSDGSVQPCRALNDGSVVFRAAYKGRAVLLTGDIEADREAELLSTDAFLRADVLKAPHHCSRTSSTPDFVRAVAPSVVVCSIGQNNRFGFPHPTVLNRFESQGIRVFRTDEQGSITISVLGNGNLHIGPTPRFFF